MSVAGEFSHTYPADIEFITEWCSVAQHIDYSEVIQSGLNQFQDEARSLCPVRTGNLLSSISGDASSEGFTAEASAEYAVYVEYGTWKMEAQPFFVEPFEMAGEDCGEALKELLQEELTEASQMAMMEIEERFMMEVEMAIEEAEIMAMSGDVLGAEMWLMMKIQELETIYMTCVMQVETQMEEYLSQGSIEIVVE